MNKNIKTGYEEMVERGELDPEKIMQDHVNDFNKGAGETPVKVMPAEEMEQERVSGFFTQQKYIIGSTPKEMEHLLGLPAGDLKNGATVYEFAETPRPDQFVAAGYTHLPGGKPYEEGGEYPPGDGVKQFRLNEPVPANVVGKIGYKEPWKGPSAELNQGVEPSSLSPDSSGEESIQDVSESVGEGVGNATAGPAGGEVGKIAGEAAGKTQEMAIESSGQSTENPVQSEEGNKEENSVEEEQDYGYGYGF